MPRQTLLNDPAVLQAALEGLERQRERTEEHIAELRRHFGKATPKGAPRKRRTMSATARKRIAQAQKKRWAEYRKGTKAKEAETPALAAKPARKKRRISAAGRKRIIEATKRRWAEYRRAQRAKEA